MEKEKMEQNNPETEKQKKADGEYLTLYQQAESRGNIIRWYPLQRNWRLLLVSEPSEALEKAVCNMVEEVVVRLPEQIEDMQSDGERYDVILHLGIIDTASNGGWRRRMECYHTLLKEDGILLLAVPNRLALKYFAGCQDESYDTYFVGPEGYREGMTKRALSRSEYEEAIRGGGFAQISYYYPYPDYLFPNTIYSSRYLPRPDELIDNIRNFDKDRYVLFEETKVYNSLLKEGVFEVFANSFFLECKKKSGGKTAEETVLYSKFSMERAEQFQIRTDIVQKAGGERVVRKYPLTQAAKEHIKRIETNYHRLQKLAEGSEIRFCKAVHTNGAAESPWVQGEVLQERLQVLLERGQKKEAEALILEYLKRMEPLFVPGLCDVDLIFSNILMDGDVWTIIDYEWTFEKDLPAEWVRYRAMLYLSVQLPGYEVTELSHLLELAGIAKADEKGYYGWETEFQRYLRGDKVPISHMVDLLGNEVIPFEGKKTEAEREVERRINLFGWDAKKLLFHLDRMEKEDGRAILCGWACAKTRQGRFIPVHITVFDQDGNPVGRAVERRTRPDVAQALRANTDFPEWGFAISFAMKEEKRFTLRFCAGKCRQDILLKELEGRKE